MATFTVALKRAIELTGGTTELVDGITKLTGGDIGIQYYPIFDEAYRDTLTGNIIDHFWNREIGFETIDMFKMRMRSRMNLIMPYYNQLYKSERLVLDPLNTVDIKTVGSSQSLQHVLADGDTTTTTESESGSRTVQSETPQVMLSPNKDYATGAADSNSKGTGNTTASETNESDSETSLSSESQTTGFQGSQSELLNAFRATFLNIDMMVISDLDELFMQVWDNNDTYTNSEERFFW